MSTSNNKYTQTLSLIFSTGSSIVFGFLINFILTRLLGREQYGNYSLFINILQLAQILFNFGLFQSICRLAAITSNKHKLQTLYTVGLIIVGLIYIIMAVAIYIYVTVNDSIALNNLRISSLIVVFFSWVYLITNLNEYYLQGSNQISLLSSSRLFPKIIFLIVLLLLGESQPKLFVILLCYFLSYIVVYSFITFRIRPTLKKNELLLIFKDVIYANKEFGFNIYLGSVVSTGSAYLAGLLISYYNVDNIQVGYYNLANQLCSPLSIFPNILATVFFKQFANSEKISNKLIILTFLMNGLLLLLLLMFSSTIITYVFGEEYIAAAKLVNYLGFGYILYGFADIYNRYFLSKGMGKELRNASFIVGLTLLISNILLVKYLNATGAALARIISGITYLLIILVLYNRAIRSK